MSRARWAVAVTFLINGALVATWVPLIPSVQHRLALSPGLLGTGLLGGAAGALLAMPLAGGWIARAGSRTVTTAGGLALGAVLCLPLLAPSLPLLFLALMLFGAATGSMDVAMNAQGVRVERELGRPVMSGFHGMFSVGGLAGAAVSGVITGQGVNPAQQAGVTGGLLALAALAASRFMLPGRESDGGGPHFALLSRPLLALGIVGFCALVGEGAMGDWSALYLRRLLHTGPTVAAFGYAAFAFCMTLGRLTGDWLTARLSPWIVVRVGGVVAAAGLAAGLILGQAPAVIVGFGLVGLGLSNVAPLMFGAAGRVPGIAPGPGIAAVTTASYAGFLAGPPSIGFVADALTLRGGLLVVVVLSATIALLAPAIRQNARVVKRQDQPAEERLPEMF